VVVDFVTSALSNVETVMFGSTPWDVPSVTEPETLTVATAARAIVRCAIPLTF